VARFARLRCRPGHGPGLEPTPCFELTRCGRCHKPGWVCTLRIEHPSTRITDTLIFQRHFSEALLRGNPEALLRGSLEGHLRSLASRRTCAKRMIGARAQPTRPEHTPDPVRDPARHGYPGRHQPVLHPVPPSGAETGHFRTFAVLFSTSRSDDSDPSSMEIASLRGTRALASTLVAVSKNKPPVGVPGRLLCPGLPACFRYFRNPSGISGMLRGTSSTVAGQDQRGSNYFLRPNRSINDR